MIIENFNLGYSLIGSNVRNVVYQFVDINFLYKKEDEIRVLLEELDEIVSESTGMPRANFVFETNEEYKGYKDIFIGEKKRFTSGYDVLFRYFYFKREQYQSLCVSRNDKGCYSDEDFERLKFNFLVSPISDFPASIPFKKGYGYYFFNPRKSDAFCYANEQLVELFKRMDFNYFIKGYSFLDKIVFIGVFKKFVYDLKRISRKIMKARECSRMVDFVNGYFFMASELINNEQKCLEDYCEKIENSKGIDEQSISIMAFYIPIWNNLSKKHREITIKNICDVLVAFFGFEEMKLDFGKDEEFNFNVVNDNTIYFGDVSNKDFMEIETRLYDTIAYREVCSMIEPDVDDEERLELTRIFSQKMEYKWKKVINYKVKENKKNMGR